MQRLQRALLLVWRDLTDMSSDDGRRSDGSRLLFKPPFMGSENIKVGDQVERAASGMSEQSESEFFVAPVLEGGQQS